MLINGMVGRFLIHTHTHTHRERERERERERNLVPLTSTTGYSMKNYLIDIYDLMT